ncbi:NAD(P)-binding domain-containing protein [Danxiaibacter flavus]|uniref:NAD(P)-binding domain-containing protein n=1 Tax=Danxiaibacter flavus TaxID=3049108 RepID=A0ABV3ZD44_9BACT|nr:NAD(P)-binding domain-containing protein [Chitinophagaceae bacterium DXS]
MKQTTTLVVGASISGLASAASLEMRGIDYLIIEKYPQIAVPWRNHYNRLHLHTNKRLSNLPHKKFDKSVPRYPAKQEVVDYLEDYRDSFGIEPVFNTEARRIRKEGGQWITETDNEAFSSKYVIMATGAFSKPRDINFKGIKTFPGKIMHSAAYKTGKDFNGENVLVVGFGNSACEIAIDLYEQGAKPYMSVRSPVNIVSRDILGIPILEISHLLSHLPPRVADALTVPIRRLLFGDIGKFGLTKMKYGPFEQIKKDGTAPVLDIGTIKHIREGHIKICSEIDFVEGNEVFFKDGKAVTVNAIIGAIGYEPNYADIVDVDKSRFDDLKLSVDHQKYFGKDGLYFCGYWIAPTGQIHEISSDAREIAKNIAEKENALRQSGIRKDV